MDFKQQIAERLKTANNVLVTVSNNPSVDQLAACIGLTLAMNKLGKHAAAVFSGQVPSTLEFLQPEKTIETTTDSLRDFIISLDKAKADKLRYKVEDKVVKIFITPYRTSITEHDLDFSQGDLNVDLVIALGVHQQNELDAAITAHGRILHDATVATLNIKPGGELGSLNWLDARASSLSEMAAGLVSFTDKQMMDGQIATAFLTGIVAETDRFSNEKTTPATMSISSELMAAGANQQLVATKLQAPAPAPLPDDSAPAPAPAPVPEPVVAAPAVPLTPPPKADDGALEIAHEQKSSETATAEESTPKIHIDEQGSLRNIEEDLGGSPKPLSDDMAAGEAEKSEAPPTVDPVKHMGSSRMVLQPPSLGAAPVVPGASAVEDEKPSGAPMTLPRPVDVLPPASDPASVPVGTLEPKRPEAEPPSFASGGLVPPRDAPNLPPSDSEKNPFIPSNVSPAPPSPSAPLDLTPSPAPSTAHEDQARIDAARAAVEQAHAAPPAAFNALPLGEPLHETSLQPPTLSAAAPPPPPPAPDGLAPPSEPTVIRPTQPPTSPPPVPPPFTPGPSSSL
jgi:hypothetical protein